MNTRRIHITEHAVFRFLERVKGVDMDAARREIAQIIRTAEDHPGSTAVLSNGYRYIIDQGSVVSVVPIGKKK